jgi:hypothetical protein
MKERIVTLKCGCQIKVSDNQSKKRMFVKICYKHSLNRYGAAR